MLFWYSSNDGKSKFGCGGIIFLLPLSLLTFFGGFDSNVLLLMLLVGVAVAAVFVLPRLTSGQGNGAKLKNDDLYVDYDEKPKRGDERYALMDDGEIVELPDDEQSSLK